MQKWEEKKKQLYNRSGHARQVSSEDQERDYSSKYAKTKATRRVKIHIYQQLPWLKKKQKDNRTYMDFVQTYVSYTHTCSRKWRWRAGSLVSMRWSSTPSISCKACGDGGGKEARRSEATDTRGVKCCHSFVTVRVRVVHVLGEWSTWGTKQIGIHVVGFAVVANLPCHGL